MKQYRNKRQGQPEYKIFKEKGKYIVRKFIGWDHSWAEYSKPLATFDTEAAAKEYLMQFTEDRNDDSGKHEATNE